MGEPKELGGGYMQMPWRLLKSDKMNVMDKVVLCYLITKMNPKEGNHAWPAEDTIGNALGVPRSTVGSSILRLRASGVLTVDKNFKARCNGYRIDMEALRKLFGDEQQDAPKATREEKVMTETKTEKSAPQMPAGALAEQPNQEPEQTGEGMLTKQELADAQFDLTWCTDQLRRPSIDTPHEKKKHADIEWLYAETVKKLDAHYAAVAKFGAPKVAAAAPKGEQPKKEMTTPLRKRVNKISWMVSDRKDAMSRAVYSTAQIKQRLVEDYGWSETKMDVAEITRLLESERGDELFEDFKEWLRLKPEEPMGIEIQCAHKSPP